jgi:hypothetical protein
LQKNKKTSDYESKLRHDKPFSKGKKRVEEFLSAEYPDRCRKRDVRPVIVQFAAPPFFKVPTQASREWI